MIWREKWTLLIVGCLVGIIVCLFSLPTAKDICDAKGGHLILKADDPAHPIQRPYGGRGPATHAAGGSYMVCEHD